MEKSKVLIIGATGNLGHHLVECSLRFSHPTFALVRASAFSDPLKSQKLHSLSNAGVTLLTVSLSLSLSPPLIPNLIRRFFTFQGSLEDEASLVEAVKLVDIVICAVATKDVMLQKLLIRIIAESGRIMRFVPAEFGCDPDKTRVSDLDHDFYSKKSEIRRLIEAQGIPYTYISCNFYMSLFLPTLLQPGRSSPPRDKFTIFGHGNVKGVFVKEKDVAAFTIKTVDDPRTLNKVLYLRPPGNVYSMNELVEIWESKIGKKLERVFVSEQELLQRIHEAPYPDRMEMVFIYSGFVKGDHTYFDIESSGGVEGTKLYPELKYTTISEYLDTLV